ncbi:MAG: RNA polymerase sigma factor [Patescibacteria group bacterium]
MKQTLEERFIAAFDEHSDAIFRFCYAQTGWRELARDLTQDTFARVWRYLIQGKSVQQMRPFLYQTARNALIDHSRRPSAQSLDELQETGFDVADECTPSPLVSASAAEAIRLAGALEDPYREAVLLRYVEALMPREIAEIIGESENVVSVRITRGMQKLRALMKI